MRVAFFTHYTALYGANRSLINLLQGLEHHECEPVVIAPAEGDITHYFRSKKIPVVVVPFPYWYSKLYGVCEEAEVYQDAIARTKGIRESFPLVSEIVSRLNIDLIYSNSSVINIGLLVALMLGKPHIWHFREYGDLDYSLQLDINKSNHKEIMRSSDGVIFVSNALKDYILGSYGHQNFEVTYNGVATVAHIKDLRKKRLYHPKKAQTIFSLVGLIHKNKGQDIAIRALVHVVKYYPNTKLQIAGNGDVRHLKRLAAELSVFQNVDFLGHISDPFGLFFNTDVSLMCSKYEAMGRVTAEAMACGCPVIGSHSGATPELIKDGDTGLIYDGSSEDLAEKMLTFLRCPSLVQEMGENASKLAEEKFSVERYADTVFNFIKKTKMSYVPTCSIELFKPYFKKYGERIEEFV